MERCCPKLYQIYKEQKSQSDFEKQQNNNTTTTTTTTTTSPLNSPRNKVNTTKLATVKEIQLECQYFSIFQIVLEFLYTYDYHAFFRNISKACLIMNLSFRTCFM
jgi:hypothetical protein